MILRGLALQFADVQPGRANVVPFELPDLACTDVKRILLNKVLTCTTTDDVAVEGCSDALTVNSRVDVPFDY